MDKKRREIIITAVLVLILILAWARSLKVLWQKVKPIEAPLTAVSPAGTKLSPSEPDKIILQQKTEEKIEWRRDPFSGKAYSTDRLSGPALKLTGIIWDNRQPQALIEDKLCSIGDSIKGCVVVDIQRDKVILSDGLKQFELKLAQ